MIVKNEEGEEVGPLIEVKGSCGVEDAITGLSQKVLDEKVVGLDVRKNGRDVHVTYHVDGTESALALVEVVKEWC